MSREERIKESFKDHVAKITQFAKYDVNADEDAKIDIGIEVLTWKKPESSNYMVKYIVSGNTLCVYGDLGEAIYQWSQNITLDWLATLDLSYFKGKCQASEVGRYFREWDENTAIKYLKDMEKQEYFEWSKLEEEGGTGSLYDARDWEEWLRENGSEVFGEDYWDWAFEIGYRANTRCVYHFIGLQMAMEQINKNAQTV